MNKNNIKFSGILLLLISTTNFAYSQGCSDAGFCTANSFKPDAHNHSDTKNQFKIGISAGQADNNISVFGNYLEYNRSFNDKISADIKVSSLLQTGNLNTAFGLSDILLTANYKVNNSVQLTLGSKIPLTDGNKKINNVVVPMDYQSSLGTFDLIAGIGFSVKKLQLATALQLPLTQNSNTFISEIYPDGALFSKFQSTNQFKRSGDILIRASYPFEVSKKLTITPSLLPIYHLSEDKFTDISGIQRTIKGSDGFTLNGNVYLDYNLNDKNALQLGLATPFLVRDIRPDGLTRKFVANLEYKIRF